MNTSMYGEMIKMTPQMAADILESKNIGLGHGNRNIRQRKVMDICNAIKRGQWDSENGESIKFDKKGNLVDGQHRLLAVIAAKKAVAMFAVFNVSSAAFATIDDTMKRSGPDTLSVYGQKNCNTTAGAITFVLLHKNMKDGELPRVGTAPNNTEILKFISDNPDIIQSVDYVLMFKRRGHRIVPFTILAGIHYMACSGGNKELADSFVEQVMTGVGLKRNTGPYLLRERMTKDMISKTRLRKVERMALIIKAWNMHINGKVSKVLRWSKDAGEKYPSVITL